MADPDTWGSDPSVQWMRRVFREIERRQQDLLRRLNLSAYDHRLRPWRERALVLFENAWVKASREGITLDDKKAGELYVSGLLRILRSEGIVAPMSSKVVDASSGWDSTKEDT